MKSLPPRVLGLLLLGLASLAACASPTAVSSAGLGPVARENAADHLAYAKEQLARGDSEGGLRRLAAIRTLTLLPPEVLSETEALMQTVTQQLLDAARAPDSSSDDLLALYEMEVPLRQRTTAGILAADRLIDEGHPVLAYKLITKIERTFPTHPMRRMAGDVLARAGLDLIRRKGRYNVFFRYKPKGAAALEFLVVHYPSSRACPEAYLALSRYYEEIGDLDWAAERLEDLLIYHADAPQAVEASARLPELRMLRLRRDDYDRRELEIADQEIRRWLALYPDHERAPAMGELLVHCHRRLAANDLVLARFYVKTGSPLGARLHAERARAQAQESDLTEALAEAEELLADLPADGGRRHRVVGGGEEEPVLVPPAGESR